MLETQEEKHIDVHWRHHQRMGWSGATDNDGRPVSLICLVRFWSIIDHLLIAQSPTVRDFDCPPRSSKDDGTSCCPWKCPIGMHRKKNNRQHLFLGARMEPKNIFKDMVSGSEISIRNSSYGNPMVRGCFGWLMIVDWKTFQTSWGRIFLLSLQLCRLHSSWRWWPTWVWINGG